MRRHVLPLAAIVAANLAPLVGILAFGWTILEVVTYVFLEGAILVLFACLRAPRTLGQRAWLVVPLYAIVMGAFLAIQSLFVVLVFFVFRFQDDFFAVVDEGFAVARGIAWGAAILVGFHLVSLVVAWLPSAPRVPAWRVLGAPAAHVLALQVVIGLGGLLVRDWGAPFAAVALLLVLKLVVDVAFYALEETVAARKGARSPR